MTDEEMIRRLAQEVMGWKLEPFPLSGHSQPEGKAFIFNGKVRLYNRENLIYFNPLLNANHWMMVVERMRELGFWVYIQGPDNSEIEWHCKFNPSKYKDSAINESLGHAVCEAAIAAIRSK